MASRTVPAYSVSPLAVAFLMFPFFWAMTAEAAGAAIMAVGGAISYLIIKEGPGASKALAQMIREIAPAIRDYKSGIRKDVDVNIGEIAKLKEQSGRLDMENVALRNQVFQLLTVHDLHVSEMGEVTLIQNGDMLDPVKEKAKEQDQPRP